MTTNEVTVNRTYDGGVGETATKSGKSPTVDLSPQAVQLVTEWYSLSEVGEGLVFEKETGGQLDSDHVIRRAPPAPARSIAAACAIAFICRGGA